jgi:hypothetical protein
MNRCESCSGWPMVLIAVLSFVAGCALTFVTLYAGGSQ